MNIPDPQSREKSAPWKQSETLPIPPDQLWDLMWRPETQHRWLGQGTHLKPARGERWALRDEAGTWRLARVVKAKAPRRITLSVQPARAWDERDDTLVAITIEPAGEAGSRLSVEERDVPGCRRDEVERFWSDRVSSVKEMVHRVRRHRRNTRQAVIVIHGIGEQHPGATLASLVKSGVLTQSKDPIWVKPDRMSDSYEGRCAVVKGSNARPTTDVFEFYWAHIIRDTTLAQVAAWLRRLLFRWRVPGALRLLWLLLWGLILGAAALGVAKLAGVEGLGRWFAGGAVGTVLAVFLWKLVGHHLAVNLLGDAARYLMPHPSNIVHRQAIRKAGVDLIKRLHDSSRYHRIVILGHSLGSVIAYDIVTFAWTEMNANHRRARAPSFKDVIKVERELTEEDASTAQRLQHDAWNQQRINTQPWLVTDLVTVGSPLTHAEFLMSSGRQEFQDAKANRILPTCPPQSEIEEKSGHHRVTYDLPYRDVIDGRKKTFTAFNHGAPFAVTRWTNLYFKPERFGTKGDLIGGPVAPHFGPWVRDVELKSPTAGVAHTWYWRPTEGKDQHLEELRTALGLNVRDELWDQLRRMDAFALID